ncbi:MAG: NADH-quinone oxidoreductase subunit NuoH [Thermoanaerobaculia bacterium]|nr:NADH-quinone oxidoreductase subunit NuoH [Thermoanaerobaculia bacterium]
MPEVLWQWAVLPLIKIGVLLFAGVMPLITYLVLAERKILGFIQVRTGPNRVGPWGLLQPIADVLKLLVKEDVIPNRAIRWAFILAPCLVVAPAFMILSVIPFGPPASKTGGAIDYYITDVNIGLLLIVALATIGVYGIILGGWSSNSKFSLLGGLRSAAQMISYEVPQGFALVVPLLMAGTMSLTGIIDAQLEQEAWFVFQYLPLGLASFFIYMVAGVAESNRNPFDLPEAESELVAGFHTEYSGMRFALFFLGEYANMIAISAVAVTLYFGGWSQPFPNVEALSFLGLGFLPAGLAGLLWFSAKLFVFLFVYIWLRGTFPRYRFDQLMDLGWKWMLPAAVSLVAATGLWKILASGG